MRKLGQIVAESLSSVWLAGRGRYILYCVYASTAPWWFLSKWPNGRAAVGHPRATAWPHQLLMVTALHRASLALKLLQKLLIVPADAPHHYWWWRCQGCSQNCWLGDAWTSLKNVEVSAVGAARNESSKWWKDGKGRITNNSVWSLDKELL